MSEPFRKYAREREAESAINKKLKRYGTAVLLSAFVHAGGIFHEEIIDAVDDSARSARQLARSPQAEKRAERLYERLGDELLEDDPVEIDLSAFYFADEVLSGGVTEQESRRAVQEYTSIINEGRELQRDGMPLEEVLGFVLKNQGDYELESAYLTDLINTGTGNCEARMKFISAATQDLYPERVADGEVKVEIFGAHKDENGQYRPGHVRVVLDEGGDTIAVLEGSSVTEEPREEHEDIPTFEATSLAIKATLAVTDLYEYTEEESQQGEEATESNQVALVEDARAFQFVSNSTLSYPHSEAEYRGGGTDDIRLEQVRGSWAPEPREWRADFILEEAPPERLTLGTIPDVPRTWGERVYYSLILNKYEPFPEELWPPLVDRMKTEWMMSGVVINPDQTIPPFVGQEIPDLVIEIEGIPKKDQTQGINPAELIISLPENNEPIQKRKRIPLEFPTRELQGTDVTIRMHGNDITIEEIEETGPLDMLFFISDADLRMPVVALSADGPKTDHLYLRDSNIWIMSTETDLYRVPTVTYESWSEPENFFFFLDLAHIDAVQYNINFPNGVELPEEIFTGHGGQIPTTVSKDIRVGTDSYAAASFQYLKLHELGLEIRESPILSASFQGSQIEWMRVFTRDIQPGAFRGAQIGTLIFEYGDFDIDPDAFKEARIDHIYIYDHNEDILPFLVGEPGIKHISILEYDYSSEVLERIQRGEMGDSILKHIR